MNKSGSTKSSQISGTDLSLIIIGIFCLLILVFIGYQCLRRRKKSPGKKNAHRRKLKKLNSIASEEHAPLNEIERKSEESPPVNRKSSQSYSARNSREVPSSPDKKHSSKHHRNGTSPSILQWLRAPFAKKEDVESGKQVMTKSKNKKSGKNMNTRRDGKKGKQGNGLKSKEQRSHTSVDDSKQQPSCSIDLSERYESVQESSMDTTSKPISQHMPWVGKSSGKVSRKDNTVKNSSKRQCPDDCTGNDCKKCKPFIEGNVQQNDLPKSKYGSHSQRHTVAVVSRGCGSQKGEGNPSSPQTHNPGSPDEPFVEIEIDDWKNATGTVTFHSPKQLTSTVKQIVVQHKTEHQEPGQSDQHMTDSPSQDYVMLDSPPQATKLSPVYGDMETSVVQQSGGYVSDVEEYASHEWKSDTEKAKTVREVRGKTEKPLQATKLSPVRGDMETSVVQQSRGDVFELMEYGSREWKSDTEKAKTVREVREKTEKPLQATKLSPVRGDMETSEVQQSVGDVFDVVEYASREWKSDTEKARTVRKGYSDVPRTLGLRNLRVVRGDNYCAIRATLFQALVNNIPILSQFGNVQKIPDKLLAVGCRWINDWTFGGRMAMGRNNVCEAMRKCLGELSNLVILNNKMNGKEGRESHLLSSLNYRSDDYELKLMEAVKLLMLASAVELHKLITSGDDAPVFAIIMYARDSSPNPYQFMKNHLNTVGDTGGLEQVEMHLLGYSLGITIRVVRPSQFGQPDFIACYPEDMPRDTPSVTLVAEDDRHYNILT